MTQAVSGILGRIFGEVPEEGVVRIGKEEVVVDIDEKKGDCLFKALNESIRWQSEGEWEAYGEGARRIKTLVVAQMAKYQDFYYCIPGVHQNREGGMERHIRQIAAR